jgi:hypothetical protein
MGRREERTDPDELDENPSFRTMDVPDGRKELSNNARVISNTRRATTVFPPTEGIRRVREGGIAAPMCGDDGTDD